MVHPSQRNALYSARKPSWSLTFRRGDTLRSYPVRPYVAASVVGILAVMFTAYVGATAYLICRDDLLGAAVSRQVKMQYSYEERIAALRAELDRLTSRHVVQTENVEQQLTTLLDQQALIEERQSSLDALVDKARSAGVAVAAGDPRPPRTRPDVVPPDAAPAAIDGDSGDGDSDGPPAVAPLSYAPEGSTAPADEAIAQVLLRDDTPKRPRIDGANIRPILSRVGSALDNAESTQSDALDVLTDAAGTQADRIAAALAPLGKNVDAALAGEAGPEGGPFIPAEGLHFVEKAAILTKTLDGIESARESAATLPLGLPVKALYRSSGFGYRLDPFLHRPAFHAGVDFVADAGTAVYPTAPGMVVSAGWSGGYGQMVEVRHSDGVSTRYGHLSQILVTPGEKVGLTTPIGRVGSTGRSTGPHLHYETRRDGAAVNPDLYLAAGRALGLDTLAR